SLLALTPQVLTIEPRAGRVEGRGPWSRWPRIGAGGGYRKTSRFQSLTQRWGHLGPFEAQKLFSARPSPSRVSLWRLCVLHLNPQSTICESSLGAPGECSFVCEGGLKPNPKN